MAVSIKTKCPACEHSSLFIGSDGYLTCGNLECPDPDYDHAVAAWSERREAAARISSIEEAHKKILEIVYTYTGGEGLENFCDVDDVSRVAMSWKIDRIKQLTSDRTGGGEEQDE